MPNPTNFEIALAFIFLAGLATYVALSVPVNMIPFMLGLAQR